MASKQNLSDATLRRRDAYQATEEQKKNRAARNAARAEMMKKGLVSKGDGKDVAHKRALINGGSNGAGNLTVQSVAKNRGWRQGGKVRPA